MIARNVPLCQWRDYEKNGRDKRLGGGRKRREADSVAREILSQMTHIEVVALMVREWKHFDGMVRVRFTARANEEYQSPSSGNKVKMLRKLNRLLGGVILSHEALGPTDRDLKVIDGRVVSINRRLDPAKVGAQRAHAPYALPPGYKKWSPARKRRYQQEMAAKRRQDKQ